MRKVLCFVLLFSCVTMKAQDKMESNENNNELKINAAYLLGGVPEITYERLLSDDQGIGISFAFSIEENDFYDFIFTPHYRLYFGKKRAAGFFMEANAAFFSERSENYGYYDYENGVEYFVEESIESQLGGGLGLAIGGKFIAKNRWVGEVYGGIGRNFVNTNNSGFSVVYPRFGISLGRRF